MNYDLTKQQKFVLSELYHRDNVILIGPAGTGKTFTALKYAIHQLLKRRINKIYVLKPPLGIMDYSMGFNKGTLEEKILPWVVNISELSKELAGQHYETVVSSTEFVPIEMIRGRTFKDGVVIVDEAQNLTFDILKTICTRMGDNCTLAVTGDQSQTDIESDDLGRFITVAKRHPNCTISYMDEVLRSQNCSDWLTVFENEEL